MASRARLIFALVLSAIGSANAGIENPTCELALSGAYRFNYVASPDAGAVEVFASSRRTGSIPQNQYSRFTKHPLKSRCRDVKAASISI
jgi:hypothetical protein